MPAQSRMVRRVIMGGSVRLETFFEVAGDGEHAEKAEQTVDQGDVQIDIAIGDVCQQGDHRDGDDGQQVDSDHPVNRDGTDDVVSLRIMYAIRSYYGS